MNIQTYYKEGIEVDIDRIIDTIKSIESNFYSENKYIITTEPILFSKKTVVMPSLNKTEYKEIIKTFSLDLLSSEYTKSEEVKKTKKILKKNLATKHIPADQKMVMDIKTEWNKIQERFFDYFEDYFQPKCKNIIININFTSYGTGSSFIGKFNKDTVEFFIWLRYDRDVSTIAFSILASYFRPDLYKQQYSWAETQSITDFILCYTKFKKLFPNFKPVMRSIRASDLEQNVINGNTEYLSQIGYTLNEEVKVVGPNVYIFGNIPMCNFTITETKILNLLLENRKKICSYFDIAHVMWDDQDSFSVWAISRMIYKIRNKLQQNGIDSSKLKTFRGKGFILDL